MPNDSGFPFPNQGPPPYGAVPGMTGTLPTGTPTPDPNAAAQQALGMPAEQMALLKQALQQAATPRYGGGQQPAVPGQQQPMSPTPPSYMTDRPYASTWGPERFLYGVQSAISQISSALEERDVRKAENQYTNMLTAAQKYMKPDGTFDANAAAQDPFLSTLKRSDYKKMANTLQESWLNPKSTTADKQGLQQASDKFTQQQQQRGRLDKFVQGLIHKATAPLRGGPQLTPEQQQAQTTEILKRAPIGTPLGSPQDAVNIAKTYQDLALGEKALQENGKVVTNYEGAWWVSNSLGPDGKPTVVRLRDDDEKRTPLTGKEFTKQGQLSYTPGTHNLAGIWWNGQFHGVKSPEFPTIPGAPEAKKDADDQFAMLQQMKIPPQYADQLGEIPVPSKYPGGPKDPQYRKDLVAYGKKAAALTLADKTQIARTYGETRAMYQIRDVLDHDEQGNPVTKLVYGKDAIGLAPGREGTQLLSKQAQIQDIEYSSDQLRNVVNDPNMKPFTTLQRAKLSLALQTGDGSVANNQIEAVASEELTPEQMQFVDWVKALNERAMSLRSIAGQGVGAQDLRDAIRGLLPSVGSGNKQRMNDQLDIFDNQVRILEKGIPSPGGFQGERGARGRDVPSAVPQGAAGGGSAAGRGAPPAAAMPPGTAGKARGSDGNWYYHDSKGKILGPAPAQ